MAKSCRKRHEAAESGQKKTGIKWSTKEQQEAVDRKRKLRKIDRSKQKSKEAQENERSSLNWKSSAKNRNKQIKVEVNKHELQSRRKWYEAIKNGKKQGKVDKSKQVLNGS